MESSGTTFPCSREILGRRELCFDIFLLRGVNILSSAQCCEPHVHEVVGDS